MLNKLRNWYFKKQAGEMVEWWKTQSAAKAKLVKTEEGYSTLHIRGEKYPMIGHPRSHVLFGKNFSPLKHWIKNKIFNDSWALLEKNQGTSKHIMGVAIPYIVSLGEEAKYEMVHEKEMVPAVKEIHRAWTKVEDSETSRMMKKILCHILQEDDAYRFRVQWLARWMSPKKPLESLERGLELMEHAEVVEDMKERIRLLRRVLIAFLIENKRVLSLFEAFSKECNWKKVKLSKGDKYYFRGKYFKVDYPDYEY